MMKEYILLYYNNMDDIRELKDGLLSRIRNASDIIKISNPTDYAAFAMLQSIWNQVTDHFQHHFNIEQDATANIDIDLHKVQHSA